MWLIEKIHQFLCFFQIYQDQLDKAFLKKFSCLCFFQIFMMENWNYVKKKKKQADRIVEWASPNSIFFLWKFNNYQLTANIVLSIFSSPNYSHYPNDLETNPKHPTFIL